MKLAGLAANIGEVQTCGALPVCVPIHWSPCASETLWWIMLDGCFFTTNIVLDQQVLTAAGPPAFKVPGTKRGAI